MKRLFKMMAAFVVAATFSGAPAVAHGTCGKRADFVRQLAQRYGEQRQTGRLPRSVMPIELYASGLNGSWTILRAHPPGMACIEASGANWSGRLPGEVGAAGPPSPGRPI